MEKKQKPTSGNLSYETPAIEVIELAETPQLLAGSPTPTTLRRDSDPTSW